MTKFPSYAVGTVSIDAGATVVAGAGGPLWTSTTNVRPGDDLVVAGHIVIIEDVIDDGHLEIDAWSFPAVPAGTPYKIVQRSPLRFSGAEAAADVIKLVAALNTEGLPIILQPGVATPDPSIGEENQFAIQPSSFEIFLKTGGAWVFQGIYKGFRLRGEWAAPTDYAVGDAVSRFGSSYVAIDPNVGKPPESSASDWQLLTAQGAPGAKGDKGDPGTNGVDGTPGAGYRATSTSSVAIGAGSKTFAVQTGLAYNVGARVRVSNGAVYMEGVVTAYDGGTGGLTISVDVVVGTGTFANWNINLAGQPGSPLGQQQRFIFSAAAGQTTFSGADTQGATLAYTPGSVEVAVNGFWVPYTDYVASNGTSIVLSSGSAAGDTVYVFALSSFNPSDTLAKSQNGGDILDKRAFRNNLGLPAVMRNYIAGLTLSTAGSSATFSVAAGVAADITNADIMTLAAAISKTTAAWAVGNNAGALDAGAIQPNTWYHEFLIKRVDTGVVDVLISVSAAAPTLPANYNLARRIGSMRTNGAGQWTSFFQIGDEFIWAAPVGDVQNNTTLTNALTQLALTVPPGANVKAYISAAYQGAVAGATILISEGFTSINPTSQGGLVSLFCPAANTFQMGVFFVLTDTSGRINVQAAQASGNVLYIVTRGWTDRRGRDN